MAEAIVSAVLERVKSILEEASLVRCVKKELLKLPEKLEAVRNVFEESERSGVEEKSKRGWLKKLEDKAYEVDDILDEWKYYGVDEASAMKKVRCSFVPSSSFCLKKVVQRNAAKKIRKVNASLDEILKEKDQFNFIRPPISITDSHPLFETTSWIDDGKVEGKAVHRQKDDIVGKLMIDDGDRQQILSIVGMGGIGKTTLAQLVYNDSRVKDCFDLRIWICVSDPFDLVCIARAIVEIVGFVHLGETDQLEVILEKLRHSISGKKFLLVLDDVWNEDYLKWEPLKISLEYGAASSKILVTTRREMVARIMGTVDEEIYRLQQLRDDESWSILRRISLRGKEDHGVFEEVGKKLARKCEGLPLALNVLGSVLQFNNSLEEWENVLESEVWQMENIDQLYPHLLLSYNQLSPPLKRCFSYCAVYPKDFRIDVDRLIEKWMALGYLGFVIGNAAVELKLKGRGYFENLAMRSLLQEFEKSGSGNLIKWCRMHPMVHDFAQSLMETDRVEDRRMNEKTCQICDPSLVSHAQEYRTLFWDKESPLDLCDCLACLRVLKYKSETIDGIPRGMAKLIHLRWLDISHTRLSKEDVETICKFHFLQTLLLRECDLKEIPCQIGNLLQLMHFDLSWNRELKVLPDSIYVLVELQILLLRECSLEKIPEEIKNLTQLRHLDLSQNYKLKELPESICNLIELQTLDIECCWNLHMSPGVLVQLSGLKSLNGFLGGSGCNKFELLKNLDNLSELSIFVNCSNSSIDMKALARNAREAYLKKKTYLRTLEIEFKFFRQRVEEGFSEFKFMCQRVEEESLSLSSLLPSTLWVDIIEALEPNENLECLKILHYKGSRLPDWISSPLNLVREIELWDCSDVLSLPPMGKLPNLEKLYIRRMDKLKVLGVEWLGIRRREGEVVTDIPSSSSSSSFVVAFPKLEELKFEHCRELVEWKDITEEEEKSAAISVMPCLRVLHVSSCNALKMLPHRLLRKVSSLEILCIRSSTHLRERYANKNDDSQWKFLSENKPQLYLMHRHFCSECGLKGFEDKGGGS